MLRTRHVAIAIALAAVTAPLMTAQSASATASTLTIGSALYTGATPTITWTDENTETGAYKLELYKSLVKVATIATGSDVTALSTLKWTIPTGAATLVTTGLTLKLSSTATTPAFTAVDSTSFAIAASQIDAVTFVTAAVDPNDDVAVTSVAAGTSTKSVRWSKLGATGAKVNIDLVQKIDGKDKRIPLVKETANDGLEMVTIPLTAVANTTTRIEVTPSNKTALLDKTSDFAVVAPGAPDVLAFRADEGGSFLTAAKIGDTVAIVWTGNAPVLIDLWLAGATKATMNVSKAATANADGDNVLLYKLPAKLVAGNYTIKASIAGLKGAAIGTSNTIAIAHPVITTTDVTGPVTAGQSIVVDWTTTGSTYGSEIPVTVSLVAGDKATALDAKAVTVDGVGALEVLIPAKTAAGTTYKIRVSNNNLKVADGTYDDTTAFTIALNGTVVA